MNEPGAPPAADQCVFITRDDEDNRVFTPGERVCVKNHEGERTMGEIVEDPGYADVRLKLETDFPSRLARGQDRAGLVLTYVKYHVGKLMSADVENPGHNDSQDPEGGRRRRRRKTTRRHRKRKTTRRR